MTVTYEDVTPSLIENTVMQKRFYDGVHKQYTITPISDYVLHDKANDWEQEDPDTYEMVTMLGYSRGTCTCGASYDFVANPREFYAVPETSVPADQIFGGVTPDHEIM